ncbi:hypothetical protein BE20_55030 [Sorangium cellulosum]|nr:hypothetical protein BE20_55030 [Sorangium cellulosum]
MHSTVAPSGGCTYRLQIFATLGRKSGSGLCNQSRTRWGFKLAPSRILQTSVRLIRTPVDPASASASVLRVQTCSNGDLSSVGRWQASLMSS